MDDAISGFQYLRERVDTHTDRIVVLEGRMDKAQEFVNEVRTHFRWIKGLGTSSLVILIIQTYIIGGK